MRSLSNIKASIQIAILVMVIGLTLFVLFSYDARSAHGQISTETATPTATFRTMTFFATTTPQTVFATSTNATSTNLQTYADANGRMDDGSFVIAGAKKVTFYFSRAWLAGNAGSSTFRVEVTPDGVNWYTFNKLVQSTSTTVQATASIAAATSTLVYSMQLNDETYLAVRCIANVTTDGQNSCSASASF